MGRYVVDVLTSVANADSIPQDANTILLVPDTFIASHEIDARFRCETNIEQALEGGCFYLRVVNEFERGLFLGIITSRWRDAKIVTSRPDYYKKFLPRVEMQLYKENRAKLYNYDSYASTEVSSEYPISPREEYKAPFIPQIRAPPAPIQQLSLQDRYLDNLYYEVLNKYMEKFLTSEEIRATKIKSAKAQIKNLADGAVISVKRKALPGTADGLPSSGELSEMIYEDLLNHKIIAEIGTQVTYSDGLMSEYFGQNKYREFKPRYKELRNQPPPASPPPQSQSQSQSQSQPLPQPVSAIKPEKSKLAESFARTIWKDVVSEVKGQRPGTIMVLAYLILERINMSKQSYETIQSDVQEDIIRRTIKSLFSWEVILLLNNNSASRNESIAENYKSNLNERIEIASGS